MDATTVMIVIMLAVYALVFAVKLLGWIIRLVFKFVADMEEQCKLNPLTPAEPEISWVEEQNRNRARYYS